MKAGKRIEKESFGIIESELGGLKEPERSVVRRVIHATADFEFKDILYFHNDPISAGVRALKDGAKVITDVEMVRAGISRKYLERFGSQALCFLNGEGVEESAAERDMTRSAAAFRLNKEKIRGSIVAIGNAPTALFELCAMIGDGLTPALVVGVPVGFVGAAESKEEILGYDVPAIVTRGRKGGSTVAAAVVNALLRLACENGTDGD